MNIRKIFSRLLFTVRFTTVFFFISSLVSSSLAQTLHSDDAAELQIALKKLNVLGSVLYIAAHPDDENTALLAYLAKGRYLRTGYLSLTRGEGGQNLIGSEQGELLGLIRTQELLAARKIDGAEQFFSNAIDFGYSKTSDETLDIWGKEKTLSDVVWVIRKFRPDVIITRFTPVLGGHGNHTASAILANEAFKAAADSTRFPEQLQFVRPWQAKRIVWNVFRFQREGTPQIPPHSTSLDLGEYSPLLGKSFSEIAGMSRSMHKSQGMGAPETRGTFLNYFEPVDGDTAVGDLFSGVDMSWGRVNGGTAVGELLAQADSAFCPENPSAIVPTLLRAYAAMDRIPTEYWVDWKKHELCNVIQWCAGIRTEAMASDFSATPGRTVTVTMNIINRSDLPVALEKIMVPFHGDSVINVTLRSNEPFQSKFVATIPQDVPYSQPYWLEKPAEKGSYVVGQQELIGRPENPPSMSVKSLLRIGNDTLTVQTPVQYRWIDPVNGEMYRPLEIVPPLAINFAEKVSMFTDLSDQKIEITLRALTGSVTGTLRLAGSKDWIIEQPEVSFSLQSKDEEKKITFLVRPQFFGQEGVISAEATTNLGAVHQGIVTINHPHIPVQSVFPPAEAKVVSVKLKKMGTSIGYIMGSGDLVPDALQQIGYRVTLLSDEDIATIDFNKFDVVIAGVRAYNTRFALRSNRQRLLQYVHDGGTYIVQYMTAGSPDVENLGPYPFSVSRDRVTVEEAPVTFIHPDNPIVNIPNKITQKDFEGWVQERGLYFADTWDQKYQTVLSCNDPGESPKDGGLIVGKYGKGYFIYSGYAWFRQLPAGVPGAFRLFVNMISLGKGK